MDDIQERFVLGSKKEHFYIYRTTIFSVTMEVTKYLQQHRYDGPIDICFPGCEQITEIRSIAQLSEDMDEEDFEPYVLAHVSSIDLSKMTNLQQIYKCCFYQVGMDNEYFTEINISCPNLEEIGSGAFDQVGQSSNYVKLTLNCPNLETIGEMAFLYVGNGDNDDDKNNNKFVEKVTLDLSKCTKLSKIEYQAFASYQDNVLVKHGEVILPDSIKIIGEQSFASIFHNCDNIIFNISNKPHLTYIGNYAIDVEKIIISNCPQLSKIGEIYDKQLCSFEIDFDSCSKLQSISGIPIELYRYYKSINKLNYLSDEYIYNICDKKQKNNLDIYYNNLQFVLEEIKFRTQQTQFEKNNIQHIADQLQQQIDLQNQIIREQTELSTYLGYQAEEYNQRYPNEDDQ